MRLNLVLLLCLVIVVVNSATIKPTRRRVVTTTDQGTTKAPTPRSAYAYLRTVRGKNSCAGGSCPFWQRHGRSFAALRCYSQQYQECTCLHRMCFSSCMFNRKTCNEEMVSCLRQICPRCMPVSASAMCAVYDSMAERVAEALSVFACYPCCPNINSATNNTSIEASEVVSTTPAFSETSTTVPVYTNDEFGQFATSGPEEGEYFTNNQGQTGINNVPGTNQINGNYPPNFVNGAVNNPGNNNNVYSNGNSNGFTNGNTNQYSNTNSNGNGYSNGNTNIYSNPNNNGYSGGNNNAFSNTNGYSNGNAVNNPNGNGVSNPNGNGASNSNSNGGSNPNGNGVSNPNGNGASNPNSNGGSNPNGNGASNPNSNGNNYPNGNTNGATSGNGNGNSGNTGNNNYSGIVFPGSDAMFYNNHFPHRNQQVIKQRARQTSRTTKRRSSTTRRTPVTITTRRVGQASVTVRGNNVKSGVRKPVQAQKKPQTNNHIKS